MSLDVIQGTSEHPSAISGLTFVTDERIVATKFPPGTFPIKAWMLETLSGEVLGKLKAAPRSDVPVITPDELTEADGLIFGFPNRFGMMAGQFKAFLDSTGGFWGTQKLAGKLAGLFYST
ncbi:hypothetical protein AgCh_022388 [Apium graveolens]